MEDAVKYHMPPPRPHIVTNAAGEQREHPGDYWDAVTDVPCPVEGCSHTVVWYEAGYVPGYRVCMAALDDRGHYDLRTRRHTFYARGNAADPVLVYDGDWYD